MPRKTIICRCEDVTLADVQEAIEHGLRDIESLKRYLAIGTGPCQGKTCLAHVARILAEADVPREEIKPMVSRTPLAWVPLGAFAGEMEGDPS
ncbi:MAG: (2Fe-2S)-binding protein [Candidatus Lernaella stagnicola]|nr:(2Fe-2S)-binding protein [Candidatus Lernaella stagnicola]